MKNRLVVGAALACLVVVGIAAAADAAVIKRQGASARNITLSGPPDAQGPTLLGPPPTFDPPPAECEPFNHWEQQGVVDLIAGQHYDVGDVWVEAYMDGPFWYLRVRYQTTGNWYLMEYHLYVGDEVPGDSPGEYPYKGEHVDAQEVVVDGIPFDGGCVYVAAHAVVERREGKVDLDKFADDLPECVDIYGMSPAADLKAYFDISVLWSDLMGDYYGWCVDTDNTISREFEYPADVWSSYDENLPSGLMENPENLDLVNWILNQEFVGKPSACGGDFTLGDVQVAIWELLENGPVDSSTLGPWDECRVNEILCRAWVNGDGFEPECGDLVGVILLPGEECGSWDYQYIIIPVPTDCDGGDKRETAWAKSDGYDCGGVSGWGSYLEFCYDFTARGR